MGSDILGRSSPSSCHFGAMLFYREQHASRRIASEESPLHSLTRLLGRPFDADCHFWQATRVAHPGKLRFTLLFRHVPPDEGSRFRRDFFA